MALYALYINAHAYLCYQNMRFVKELSIARRDCEGKAIALQLWYHIRNVFTLQDNDIGEFVGLECV